MRRPPGDAVIAATGNLRKGAVRPERAAASAENIMEARLWSRLSELGWNTVPIEDACLNIIWLYAAGGFDLSVLRRFGDEDGSLRTDGCGQGAELDSALLSVSAMLDEAARVGRLDFLAAPSVRTPEQIVSMVSRRFGQEE